MLQHFIIRHAHNVQAKFLQASRALRVARQVSRIGMLTAVQLDHQIRLKANKIDDVSADRMLPRNCSPRNRLHSFRSASVDWARSRRAKVLNRGDRSWRPSMATGSPVPTMRPEPPLKKNLYPSPPLGYREREKKQPVDCVTHPSCPGISSGDMMVMSLALIDLRVKPPGSAAASGARRR